MGGEHTSQGASFLECLVLWKRDEVWPLSAQNFLGMCADTQIVVTTSSCFSTGSVFPRTRWNQEIVKEKTFLWGGVSLVTYAVSWQGMPLKYWKQHSQTSPT